MEFEEGRKRIAHHKRNGNGHRRDFGNCDDPGDEIGSNNPKKTPAMPAFSRDPFDYP